MVNARRPVGLSSGRYEPVPSIGQGMVRDLMHGMAKRQKLRTRLNGNADIKKLCM
jgi:hypothetical protein